MDYSKLFELDLAMLRVRVDWNKVYWKFIDNMNKFTVKTKKDWEHYLSLKEEMVGKAWETFTYLDNN